MLPNAVVWLVRDTCRKQDNPAFQKACDIATDRKSFLLPLACLEPRRWAGQQMSMPRVSKPWAKFRAESLHTLRNDLSEEGTGLWLSAEEPVHALMSLVQKFSITHVVTDHPLATEERAENAKIAAEGFEVIDVFADELFELNQLPFGLDDFPSTFSKFRRAVEKNSNLSLPRQSEQSFKPKLHRSSWFDPAAFQQALKFEKPDIMDVPLTGGAQNALSHWQDYLDSRALSTYKKTRNALFGLHKSSHLSAWLAHGCLSPRRIWQDTLIYEKQYGANDSTYWLRFELLWREYFRWYARACDSTLFRFSGPEDRPISGDQNSKRFLSWTSGATGCDIVDAGIAELNETGWVSNRMRQLMASHLIYELNLDWRLGAAYFESRLIDHDVASNWGNWAYIAGVGPDPRGGRVFNLEQQANRYDADFQYRAFWLSR